MSRPGKNDRRALQQERYSFLVVVVVVAAVVGVGGGDVGCVLC